MRKVIAVGKRIKDLNGLIRTTLNVGVMPLNGGVHYTAMAPEDAKEQ